MRLLLCRAPQLLPRASPQPVKFQSHKSWLSPKGQAVFLPLHPSPISISSPKREQTAEKWQKTQAKGFLRTAVGGGFLGHPSSLLLWHQPLPGWAWTL